MPMPPWRHPTMLAPLDGVSHPELRALMAARGGIGVVCTGFVRVGRGRNINRRALRRAVVKAPDVPLSVQLMGNDPERMSEAASVVAEAGADVVDVNLGCPMPRIVRKGVGAALLEDRRLLYHLLSAMRARVSGLLSAKIRAGFDGAGDTVAIGRTVEAAGVDYLVVHPRRRSDYYEGVADWRLVRALKEALRIPVIGNGDLWCAADALRMQAESGCDGVMIGRPALRNPWIFRQIADLRANRPPLRPSGADVVEHVREIHRAYARAFADHKQGGVGKLKELIHYLGGILHDGGEYRRRALHQQTLDEILSLTDETFGPLGPGDLDLDPEVSSAFSC